MIIKVIAERIVRTFFRCDVSRLAKGNGARRPDAPNGRVTVPMHLEAITPMQGNQQLASSLHILHILCSLHILHKLHIPARSELTDRLGCLTVELPRLPDAGSGALGMSSCWQRSKDHNLSKQSSMC